MKRLGLYFLSVVLIVALLLAFLPGDRLAPYIGFFTGGISEKETPPVSQKKKENFKGDNFKENRAEQPVADLKNLARQITVDISDDYGKMCAIYDWITANIAYDLEKAKKIEDYGYGAKYLLENRKGVCHDYAELTRALLKAVGIKATYERGEVYPAPGKTENHAWNHVLVGETWYGLDTTWGSGFINEEKGVFVQRPSRLYLTTLEELARLHRDPAYKEACEIEWRKNQAAAAKPIPLPEYETRLLELFNETRTKTGLAPFNGERRLLATVRQSAVEAAAKACQNEEYSLDRLNKELERSASQLRLAQAGLYAFTLWDFPVPTVEELHQLILDRQDTFLKDSVYRSLAVGVVRRGDLIAVVLVGLSYHQT